MAKSGSYRVGCNARFSILNKLWQPRTCYGRAVRFLFRSLLIKRQQECQRIGALRHPIRGSHGFIQSRMRLLERMLAGQFKGSVQFPEGQIVFRAEGVAKFA